jgi:hypothetical protein
MSLGQSLGMDVGPFTVATTTNKGHDPEFYAERIMDRLMFVSENVPEPIRAQALAYQESMRSVILAGLKRACLSDRTTVIAMLKQAGMEDAATLVWKMGT